MSLLHRITSARFNIYCSQSGLQVYAITFNSACYSSSSRSIQLRTVKPYLCMYLIAFTWSFFVYLYIGSSVPFYEYLFIHCIVTRTYIICTLHSIVRINHWIELNWIPLPGRHCPDFSAKLMPVLRHSACCRHRTTRVSDVFLPSLSWLSSASFSDYHYLHYCLL